MKRVKWTYEAELDYIHEQGPGEWIIGFLDEEGTPYECPRTTDETLIRKLEKLEDKKLRVTVEVNEELDSRGQQHPKLLDVHVQKKRRQA